MTDIHEINSNLRKARASGKIFLKAETIDRIRNNFVQKGDVETIARIAAINAVKKVPDLIPLCHPIPINNISVDMNFEGKNCVNVSCTGTSTISTVVVLSSIVIFKSFATGATSVRSMVLVTFPSHWFCPFRTNLVKK